MKYLIFGKGMIGSFFHDFLEDNEISSTDITDYSAIKKEILEKNPEIILNCAGKTGRPNVDGCEDDKLGTLQSNVVGPLTLLKACQELNKYFVHVGSGCVYEGDNNGKGFSEEDVPNFYGSYYSKTKIWSQEALKDFDNVLILRLRMPILSYKDKRNFITKIVSYPKVINIANSMSILDDFLLAAKHLMENKKEGTWNMTNPGAITQKEILDMYKEIVDSTHTCEYISLEGLYTFTKAQRSNCVLNSDKLQKEFPLKPIKERIREILLDYKEKL